MAIDYCEEQRIWPAASGGVVVVFGGTAEMLTKAEAMQRRAYCLDRAHHAHIDYLAGRCDAVASHAAERRAMAYSQALNHPYNL